jgi:UDP-glucose 4-epimerase
VNSRALIETAVKQGVHHFIFSSTAAVYGNPERVPACEDDPTLPTSPYGSSKLMAEIMLRDAGAAHGLRHMILRYFNVAGADPLGRTGHSTTGATHLIKVAVETALGLRPKPATASVSHVFAGTAAVAAFVELPGALLAEQMLQFAHLTMQGLAPPVPDDALSFPPSVRRLVASKIDLFLAIIR